MSPALSALFSVASSLIAAGVVFGLLVGRLTAVEKTTERHERDMARKEVLEAGLAHIDKRLDRIEVLLTAKGTP